MKVVQYIGPLHSLLRNAEHNHEFFAACGFKSHVRMTAPLFLNQNIRDVRPDRAIIRGCWCPLDILAAIVKENPDTAFYVTNHSTPSQMYQQQEWQYFLNSIYVLRDAPNLVFTSADEPTTAFLKAVSNDPEKVRHAPNVYWTPKDVELRPVPTPAHEFHVGCFHVYRYQKNLPTVMAGLAIAAAALKRDGIRLFVHYRVRPRDEELVTVEYAKLIRPVIMAGGASVNDGWTETGREHLDLCRRMTAHVQCSFAESFCYAAGDAIVCGLPVVGSPAIPWLPDAWRMTNAADPRELAIRVLDAPDWNPQDGRDALDRYNRTAAPLALLGFDLCDNAGEAERVSAVALQQKGKP